MKYFSIYLCLFQYLASIFIVLIVQIFRSFTSFITFISKYFFSFDAIVRVI